MTVDLVQNIKCAVEPRLPETRNRFSFVISVEEGVVFGLVKCSAFSASLWQKRNSAVTIEGNFFALLYIFIIQNANFPCYSSSVAFSKILRI
jgi:hypothetical protein